MPNGRQTYMWLKFENIVDALEPFQGQEWGWDHKFVVIEERDWLSLFTPMRLGVMKEIYHSRYC